MIGANGAGKTTLFNVVTGDFPATRGRVRFFGEDVTTLPPYERIRMGLRRTYQSSLLFRDLSVRDNLFLAVRGVSRNRFSFLRAPSNGPADELLERVRLTHVAESPVAALSHGQQRQLEIGMALAGAPRLILFDEPAAGLSPGERAELVALLRSLPAHIGFILIEHDLDIALRVVDRVTVLHNARVLKHGSPAEIEDDAEVQAIYMGNARAVILEIRNLDVYYGRAHALQGVSLALDRGVLAVVGRNGMGKTTLCNAVTGLVPASGSVKVAGEEVLGLPPNAITAKGVGYVPQGRRLWPSLSVDEHLRLAQRPGPWTAERIYQTFPRLAERRRNGGAELSGGEQQMLAISRALLFNPKLLVMDEPTEGLAPIIVQQVEAMLKALAAEGEISVLLIEQNLGVAIDVADTVDVMVNGRIARSMPTAELAADRDLQQRLLGVKMDADLTVAPTHEPEDDGRTVQVLTVKRAADSVVVEPTEPASAPMPDEVRTIRGFTRWGSTGRDRAVGAPEPAAVEVDAAPTAELRAGELLPVAQTAGRAAYIAGTFDTKGRELFYLRTCLERLGLRTVTVDLATSGKPSPATVHPREVARHHPGGERAVFTGDRGSAVTEMAVAFEEFVARRRDIGGLISAGGSGGTALATRAMRRLPIGVPKVMVSTVASGDVKPYVGPSDICMMYSVTDVAGINRISEKVLANAAHALAGMLAFSRAPAPAEAQSKPALGLTMFGLTTPCVQAVCQQLEAQYDCLVFHATGTGGQSMEKLADSGLLAGGARPHHHRGRRRDRRGSPVGGPRAHGRLRARRHPVRRLLRRARHGQLLGPAHRPRALPGPDPPRPQPQRDPDAHHARRGAAHRPVHRRQAQPHGGSGAVPDPGGRPVGPRPAGGPVLGSGRRQGALRRHRDRVPRERAAEAHARPEPHQRPRVRRRLVAAFNEVRTEVKPAWPESTARTS